MKIEIEVSDRNEGTAEPWWMIIDPKQNLETHGEDCLHRIAGMINGPFFSREEGETWLTNHRYNYGPNAHVYCASGCYTIQYTQKYREAEETKRGSYEEYC